MQYYGYFIEKKNISIHLFFLATCCFIPDGKGTHLYEDSKYI